MINLQEQQTLDLYINELRSVGNPDDEIMNMLDQRMIAEGYAPDEIEWYINNRFPPQQIVTTTIVQEEIIVDPFIPIIDPLGLAGAIIAEEIIDDIIDPFDY